MTGDRAAIASELERIFATRGRLTPADVVEEAAAETSPMHAQFEWDDTEAARRFRVVQAAGLIRSFKVTITKSSPSGEVEDLRVRSWVAARHAGDAEAPEGYLPEHVVRLNPAQQHLVLQQMLRELASLRRRYAHLTEFWQQVAALAEEQVAS